MKYKKEAKVPSQVLKIATCFAVLSSGALPYYAVENVSKVHAVEENNVQGSLSDFDVSEWEYLGVGVAENKSSAKLAGFISESEIGLYNTGDLTNKVDVDFKRYEYTLVGYGPVRILDTDNRINIMDENVPGQYVYPLNYSRDKNYEFNSTIDSYSSRTASWTLYRKAKSIVPTTKINSTSQTPLKDGNMTLTVNGTVKDENVNDELTVKYAIDGGAEKVGKTLTADGTEQEYSFNALDDEAIAEGSHTLEVWTEDNNSNVSAKISKSFMAEKAKEDLEGWTLEKSWSDTTTSISFPYGCDNDLITLGSVFTKYKEGLEYKGVLYRNGQIIEKFLSLETIKPKKVGSYGFEDIKVKKDYQLFLYSKAKNTAPTTKINSTSQTPLKDGKMTLTVYGTVKDENVNDELTVKYAIDGGAEKVGKTLTADGTEQEYSFNALNNDAMAVGSHIVEVWIEDSNGNVSDKDSASFTVENNSQTNDGWEQVISSGEYFLSKNYSFRFAFNILDNGNYKADLYGADSLNISEVILAKDYSKYNYRTVLYRKNINIPGPMLPIYIFNLTDSVLGQVSTSNYYH